MLGRALRWLGDYLAEIALCLGAADPETGEEILPTPQELEEQQRR